MREKQKKMDVLGRREIENRILNENDIEGQYATVKQQKELKRKIEAQDLPVRNRMGELELALEEVTKNENEILLLQGETGSGKSVYSPIAVLNVLRKLNRPNRVFVLQPRRDACRGLARANAAVTGKKLGKKVGFTTSEAKEFDRSTEILFMTPGILLRYLQEGRINKKEIGALVLDEIHEGSVEYHLIMGLIKIMHEEGNAPLTLLTSATFDRNKFQRYLGIDSKAYRRIEGRAHPVDKKYLSKKELENGDYLEETANTVLKISNSRREGDILVFLPGEKEINIVSNKLVEQKDLDVVPLFGRLSPQDRDNALSGRCKNGKNRRVILATNIAETSVTVPNIMFVVDSGRQRLVKFNTKTGITEMGTEFISKDQAEQRAGRAGRLGPGECYRVYSERKFNEFDNHPRSEIHRSNLSSVILRLKALGLDPKTFPFIDMPRIEDIDNGLQELIDLGVIDNDGDLTSEGYQMIRLPFEPRLSRMIVEAQKRNCLEATLVLVGFLRESNIFLGPTVRDIENYGSKRSAQNAVKEIHSKFKVENSSDIIKNLNLFIQAIENGLFESFARSDDEEIKAKKANFKDWCKENYVKYAGLQHIAKKLNDYAKYAGVVIDRSSLKEILEGVDLGQLGAVILSGHVDKLMVKTYEGGRGMVEYRKIIGSGTSEDVNLSPGSDLFHKSPQVIVAGEIQQGRGTKSGAETVRNYAHAVHPVDLKQLREVIPHLMSESFGKPGYNREYDRVECEVTSYFTGQNNRTVLGVETREVEGELAVRGFAKALVQGRIDLPFHVFNKNICSRLKALHVRSRGLIDLPDMESWYVERLSDLDDLANYLRAAANDELLRMDFEDFCSADFLREIDAVYPESVEISGKSFVVSYAFDRRGYSTDNHNAIIKLDTENLFFVDEGDIPKIGDDETVNYFEHGSGYNVFRTKDLNELKERVDGNLILDAWREWKEKPEPQKIELGDLEGLPPVTLNPLKYATSFRGEEIMAYPAMKKFREYVDGGYKNFYAFCYFENSAKAESSQNEAESARENDIKEMQEKIDLETLLEPARIQLEEIKNEFAEMIESFKDSNEKSRIKNKLKEAENFIKGLDYYGYRSKAKPREAMELMDKIREYCERLNIIRGERAGLLPIAEELRSGLQPTINEVFTYSEYDKYGVTYEMYRDVTDKWLKISELVSSSDGDLREAIELMEALKVTIDLPNYQDWATEDAKLYRKMESQRGRGVFARIEIKNGSVFDVDGEEIFEFSIGSSGRKAVVVKLGKMLLIQPKYSSGNEMGEPFRLKDGGYVFMRDMNAIFQVEFGEGGRVFKVLSKVEPEYLDVSIYENEISYGVSIVEGSGLGAMAAAFASMGKVKNKKPVKTISEKSKVAPKIVKKAENVESTIWLVGQDRVQALLRDINSTNGITKFGDPEREPLQEASKMLKDGVAIEKIDIQKLRIAQGICQDQVEKIEANAKRHEDGELFDEAKKVLEGFNLAIGSIESKIEAIREEKEKMELEAELQRVRLAEKAKIEEARAQKSELEKKLKNIEKEIEAVESETDNLKSRLEALNNELAESYTVSGTRRSNDIQKDISDVDKAIEVLKANEESLYGEMEDIVETLDLV